MAWTTPRTWTTGELVTASIMNTHVRDDLAYLHGDSSTIALSNSLSVTDYFRVTNSSGQQKLLMGNQDGGGASNPAILMSANGALSIGGGDSWTTSGGTFTATMQIGDGLNVYIGDTANALMTQGLTINQGTNTNEILSFKSTNIAHGMTTGLETDTFGNISQSIGDTGGLRITGYTEDNIGLHLIGTVTNGDTTKSTAGKGCVYFVGNKKSGTSPTGAPGANENLVAVTTNGTTRFILDSDGDSHQDVGTAWTNFDSHADADLLTALSVHVSRPGDPIKTAFRKFLRGNRRRLEALELVQFNRDGHHFVNMSRLTMLLVGAVRQTNQRVDRLVGALLSAGVAPALLKGV